LLSVPQLKTGTAASISIGVSPRSVRWLAANPRDWSAKQRFFANQSCQIFVFKKFNVLEFGREEGDRSPIIFDSNSAIKCR
jgi:hypothetical protein